MATLSRNGIYWLITISCISFAQMPSAKITMPAGQKMSLVKEDSLFITLKDSRGKEVTIAKKPKRVLPLYTSYLNVWYECGGKAIGRPTTEAALVPEEALPLPTIGHVTSPNLEKVISLKPDLILLRYGFAGHTRLAPMLEKMNIPFISLTYENFHDYITVVDIFTRLTGREDIRTDSLPKIKRNVQRIIESAHSKSKPKVLILFGSAMGVVVKLPGSLVGSMVDELGGKNIASDAKLTSDEMQIFSMERVVERDPEVILVQTMGLPKMVKKKIQKDIASSPAWKTISAVKNNRVHYLPVNGFLYKPNKRFPKSYEYLQKLLYPESG